MSRTVIRPHRWASVLNTWRDETGVYRLLAEAPVAGVAVVAPACGTRVFAITGPGLAPAT